MLNSVCIFQRCGISSMCKCRKQRWTQVQGHMAIICDRSEALPSSPPLPPPRPLLRWAANPGYSQVLRSNEHMAKCGMKEMEILKLLMERGRGGLWGPVLRLSQCSIGDACRCHISICFFAILGQICNLVPFFKFWPRTVLYMFFLLLFSLVAGAKLLLGSSPACRSGKGGNPF